MAPGKVNHVPVNCPLSGSPLTAARRTKNGNLFAWLLYHGAENDYGGGSGTDNEIFLMIAESQDI